jgi:hypothetical protein
MSPDALEFEKRFWLARVWADGESRSKLIGTAFAISRNYLLTCGHVVAEAGGTGPGGRVYVDFPLVGTRGNWAPRQPFGITNDNFLYHSRSQ